MSMPLARLGGPEAAHDALDLWLVRHAESAGNVDGSESDTQLSPRGREQARRLVALFSAVDFDRVVTSPLLRACETAAIALPGREAVLDPRLVELRGGPRAEVVDTSALDAEALRILVSRAPVPEESGSSFMARVRAFTAELPPRGRVVAFTHFAVVREIAAVFLGFRNAPPMIAHASVLRIEVRDGIGSLVALPAPA
jgi:broad specificity phosphatase PhoE